MDLMVSTLHEKMRLVPMPRTLQLLKDKHGYSDAETREIHEEYCRYIALCAGMRHESIPVCDGVDDLWHSHILCSTEYFVMCRVVGVGYICHNPHLSTDDKEVLDEEYSSNTLRVYTANFGAPTPKWAAGYACCSWDRIRLASIAEMEDLYPIGKTVEGNFGVLAAH